MPFTVFAPTNEAFAKLAAGTVEALLKPENKDKLTKILACHVVAADAMAADIEKMIKEDGGKHAVKTVGGCLRTAWRTDRRLRRDDETGNMARVTVADVQQSNGVRHVIDRVLLPKRRMQPARGPPSTGRTTCARPGLSRPRQSAHPRSRCAPHAPRRG